MRFQFRTVLRKRTFALAGAAKKNVAANAVKRLFLLWSLARGAQNSEALLAEAWNDGHLQAENLQEEDAHGQAVAQLDPRIGSLKQFTEKAFAEGAVSADQTVLKQRLLAKRKHYQALLSKEQNPERRQLILQIHSKVDAGLR